MSARAIVILGLCILAMVLIGTMTVGISLSFYVGLTLVAALIAGLATRHTHNQRSGNQDLGS